MRHFSHRRLGSMIIMRAASGKCGRARQLRGSGKRRFPNGVDDSSGRRTSETTRGFAGQRELTDVGLVHLNGRCTNR
jgi:hypothetical protein